MVFVKKTYMVSQVWLWEYRNIGTKGDIHYRSSEKEFKVEIYKVQITDIYVVA